MIRLNNDKYKEKYSVGIEATRDFLEKAKVKGVKILHTAPEYFLQNVNLWCIWLENCKVNVIAKTTNPNDILEDDLCILIAHGFDICKSKCYVAVNTESLVTRQLCYNSIFYAHAVWDYSIANTEYLMTQQGVKNVVPLPVLFSNNTDFFKNVVFTDNFDREYDIIIPINSERRQVLLKKFKEVGLKCISVWRGDLPGMINKCKIFLNVHVYHGNSALEIHRIFEARNMPIVIVSEDSEDVEYQNQLNKIPFIKYDQLFAVCCKICTDVDVWKKCLAEQREMWKQFPDSTISTVLSDYIIS